MKLIIPNSNPFSSILISNIHMNFKRQFQLHLMRNETLFKEMCELYLIVYTKYKKNIYIFEEELFSKVINIF